MSLWLKVFATLLGGFATLWIYIWLAIVINKGIGDWACLIFLVVAGSAIVATCVVAIAQSWGSE